MRSKSILTAATFAAFLMAAVPATFAQVDGDYRSAQDGDWDQTSTWERYDSGWQANPANPPGASNFVTIRHTVTVDTSEAADHVTVDAAKLLDISTSGTLTLDGSDSATHNVAGEIRLSAFDSILAFTSNSQTLNGAGKIEGRHNTAKITIADTYDLTSNIDVVGSLQIRGLDTSDPPDAGFENNDVVEANRATDANDNKLVLHTGRFTGSGEWKMATADAFLNFASGIKADATTAPKLTGPFTVSNGTLEIDENVTTTGSLSFSGGKIQVASGKRFITDN